MMESLNFNLELTEEQRKYRDECIAFCMNNSSVLNFLTENLSFISFSNSILYS